VSREPDGGEAPLTAIPPATLAAYRTTDYHVFGPPPLLLRVDEANAGLRALHARHGVTTSAFLTAWNPASETRPAAENHARQADLEAGLQAAGYTSLRGEGRHPTNGWPGEASVLVLGLLPVDAGMLGRRYGQNAILCCGEDAVPRLVLLR